MDPRFNPNLPTPRPQPVVQDIRPVPVSPQPSTPPPAPPPQPQSPPQATQAAASAPMAPHQPAGGQVVTTIPMHQQDPSLAAAGANPIVQAPVHGIGSPEAPLDELDHILQAVNNRVKQPSAAKSSKKAEAAKKLSAPAGKLKTLLGGHGPIGAIAVTVIVLLALSATAFMAYHQGQTSKLASQPGKVGTSYIAGDSIQQAGGTLVRPSELDDFSNGLQTKLNSLNDNQDFNAASLSDHTLGL